MKKQPSRKLHLTTETLRQLTGDELRDIAGGLPRTTTVRSVSVCVCDTDLCSADCF